MTASPQNTETTYALAGTNLGPFASGWVAESLSEVAVWLDVGLWPALINPALYSVAGASPLTNGLTVTLLSANLPSGGAWTANCSVTLQRVTPRSQAAALGQAVGFNPAAYEAALDHLSYQIQELATALSRVLATAPGDYPGALPSAELRAGGYLAFDASGSPVIAGGQVVVASANVNAGQLVNQWNNGGVQNVQPADNTAGLPAHGFALATVLSGASVQVAFAGQNTAVAGLTPGPVYLSSAGAMTSTPPSTAGQLLQPVGVALSSTRMVFMPQTPVLLS